MRVLLSTPPGKTEEKWPPLGLLYLASSIKAHSKHSIKVVDAFCLNLDKPGLIQAIEDERPDVIGLSTSTHTFLDSMEALEEASRRLPDAKIILGGYHATFAAEEILRAYPFVDYILKGEAEYSMLELLDCIEKGRDPAGVEGISYLFGGRYVSNEPSLVDDLDGLPLPDRGFVSGIDYGYTYHGIPLTFGKFTTMSTSRGCPYQCSYCSCASFSRRKLRYRSAESVVEELQMLYESDYRTVVIVDDNFTHNRSRVEKICDLIKEKRIRMKLYCEGRVNNASLALLKRMKSVGFDVIFFGAESASKHVLDYYDKKAVPEQTVAAVENAKRSGMVVITSFILGAPVESEEDMQMTIDLIRRLRPHGVEINILDILIGTKLWDDMRSLGKVGPDDWKTNHRIYEYMDDEQSMEALERLVGKGYDAYIGSWKSAGGMAELSSLLARNRTMRDIIFYNLFNTRFWATIRGGIW